MKRYGKLLFLTTTIMGVALVLAACAAPAPIVQTQEVTREIPVEVTQVVEVTPVPVVAHIPFEELWVKSAHADQNDTGASIGYTNWTPRLLKAAYNYQYSQKDPGAFAHNGQYVIQILFDSLKDVGASTSGMTRP